MRPEATRLTPETPEILCNNTLSLPETILCDDKRFIRDLDGSLAYVLSELHSTDIAAYFFLIHPPRRSARASVSTKYVGVRKLSERDVKALQEGLKEAAEKRAEARQEIQANSGGDDAAAKAAAERQEAIAAMRQAAERYVRFRTSAMLLRWVLDRFRKEKQGPLLKRAGELFQVLTLGSFDRLSVQFDDQDQMQLAGVRPNGSVVSMPGLTSGTEDQLFLALRIAAIEDYFARATALPFVADDLFINFDPGRSAAGFDVLGPTGGEDTSAVLHSPSTSGGHCSG